MVKHGTKRSVLDRRDYAFHRTFPKYGASMPQDLPLMEYNYDAGLTIPDQNGDGWPYGCTGYTQTDLKQNQDKVRYEPAYTYLKTCMMEGHPPNQGCDVRISAKSLRVYGAEMPEETTDVQAAQHRSGQTFVIDRAPGRDWFDSFRIALRARKQGISTGTPWFPEWQYIGRVSILRTPVMPQNIEDLAWHNYCVVGETTIDGKPYLRVKSWQGANYGQDGWVFMSRETFNVAFNTYYGTIGLITAKAAPEDIQTIKLDMYQTVLTYLNRILAIISNKQVLIHA